MLYKHQPDGGLQITYPHASASRGGGYDILHKHPDGFGLRRIGAVLLGICHGAVDVSDSRTSRPDDSLTEPSCTSRKQIMYNPAGAWPLTFPCSKYQDFFREYTRANHQIVAGFTVALGVLGDIFQSHAFWIIQAFFIGYICLAFLILLPCWLYRIISPADPELLAAREKYFEEAYDHVNYWSSIRMAGKAEDQYLAKEVHREGNPTDIPIDFGSGNIKGFKTHVKGKGMGKGVVPIAVDLNTGDHFILENPPVLSDDLWRMSLFIDEIDVDT